VSDDLRVVPANEAPWEDLDAVYDFPGACHCQRFKVREWVFHATEQERAAALRLSSGCDDPTATSTTGLLLYVGDEPAAFAAVEPRSSYPGLAKARVPWAGRDEDRDDPSVWAVTCLVVRRGFRKRGLTYALAEACVAHARDHGARVLEAYPLDTDGREVVDNELYVGAYQVFADLGFSDVTRPTKRRVVVHREL
jgi:GNAT superfamily N-acetyltransferase